MEVEIGRWLQELGMERYEQAFREHEVDANVLPHLTSEDLGEIGVTAIGHRRRILTAIAELSTNETPAPEAVEADKKKPQNQQSVRQGESERRQITIVFCDLVGSTDLSEKLDAEELRELITRYHSEVTGVIERYDGFVAQYLGDGILAYFGWPIAHEDDAERAVRASLEMIENVERLEIPGEIKLACRVGIATGPVVVGDSVGEHYSEANQVVGRTPNLAARLQSLAEINTVVISPETRRIVRDGFELTDSGLHTLRGIAGPIRVWRVDKPVDSLTRFATRSRAELPLLDREEEIAQLADGWRHARSGKGRLMHIRGEPGIGKSRLVEEMRRRVSQDNGVIYECQCSPFHRNDALYPIFRQLDDTAQQINKGSNDTTVEAFAVTFAKAGLDVDETKALFSPFLSKQQQVSTRSETLDAQGRKEKTFRALLSMFGFVAARKPVMLVFEDVQWIDPTTSEFLQRFADDLRNMNVLCIFTSRPGDIAVMGWLEHTVSKTIELGRLSLDAVGQIIGSIAGESEMSTEIRDLIKRRTDGIPLFVEELSKTVLESGIADAKEDNIVQLVPDTAIPTTLHDSLVARLDRHPRARGAAQIAAAIGREFSVDVLTRVSGENSGKLNSAIAELVDADIMVPNEEADGVFYFKHALMRDAAYSSMLRRVRTRVHGQIGATLQSDFASITPPHILAGHWALGGHHAQAAQQFGKAAEDAKSRYANSEAIAYFQQTLSHIEKAESELAANDNLPDRIALLENLSTVQTLVHDIDGATSTLQTAIAEAGDDDVRRVRLLRLLGLAIQQDRKRSLEALDAAETALNSAASENGFDQLSEWIDVQLCKLTVYYWSGHGSEMTELAESLAPYIERASPEQRAEYFDQLVLRDLRNYRYQPPAETLDNAENYLDAARQTGNLAIIASAFFIVGFVHLHHGTLDEAEQAMRDGLDTARKCGHRAIELRCTTYLATVFRRKGELDEAISLSREARQIASLENMNEYVALATGNLAWAAWCKGDFAKAKSRARKALKRFKKSSIAYPFEWSALLPMIALSEPKGDFSNIRTLCRRLIDPSQQMLPEALNDAVAAFAVMKEPLSEKKLASAFDKLLREAQSAGFL